MLMVSGDELPGAEFCSCRLTSRRRPRSVVKHGDERWMPGAAFKCLAAAYATIPSRASVPYDAIRRIDGSLDAGLQSTRHILVVRACRGHTDCVFLCHSRGAALGGL